MSEQVRCVLHNIKKPKVLGAPDVYNVAVTETRCIFAKLTSELLKKAAAEANQKAKEEGKGFLSRWSDQVAATLKYGDRYLTMSPEDVLREDKHNFFINHADIKSISFYEKHRVQDANKTVHRIYGEVTFDTSHGKSTYQLDGMPLSDISAIRGIIGDKVRG